MHNNIYRFSLSREVNEQDDAPQSPVAAVLAVVTSSVSAFAPASGTFPKGCHK